ncbi:MAG: helix-turn-helix domain-containing protein [Actinomycetota bacterium]|jgi:predicted ArsR family transcriptional regulator|nr:helix-turn-helix domain-containing protein [Actinomycetota bacterium]
MTELGDDAATRTAKVLSLPTRAAILSMLLRTGPKTVKEIADTFRIHPNVARAHLDLMVEAGFLMTETRRRNKGRPAKVYFTWEGEAGALAEAGVDVEEGAFGAQQDEIQVQVRVLERMLADSQTQLQRIRELMERHRQVIEGGELDV